MTREEKEKQIALLKEKLDGHPHFYIADIEGLNASQTMQLRKKCFEESVELRVVRNTLFHKALESSDRVDFSPVYDALKGTTCVLFSEVGNVPARLIKSLRGMKWEKPVLKAAYVEESFYVGDDQLEVLSTLKSHDELIGDIVMLLQSPMRNVVGALQSGGSKISGVLKTLSERE
ncbi:MAG: 50S ribosomal protein L10 [Bacteroidia bacterium]|jgi:hypothetical protein|nr:50S ribosomal protein L10 [Bacteroidia bacterium]MBB1540596.1 50S ribosomal protein L10 [Bacteroidia bacterium]